MFYFGRKVYRIFGWPYSTDQLSTEVKTSCTYEPNTGGIFYYFPQRRKEIEPISEMFIFRITNLGPWAKSK